MLGNSFMLDSNINSLYEDYTAIEKYFFKTLRNLTDEKDFYKSYSNMLDSLLRECEADRDFRNIKQGLN